MSNPDCVNFRDIALLGDLYNYSKAEIAAAQEHVKTCPDCQKYAVETIAKFKRLGGGLKYTQSAKPRTLTLDQCREFQATRPACTTDFEANTWDTASLFTLD